MKRSLGKQQVFSCGFSPKELKRATGGLLVSGEGAQPLLGVSTDSRTLRPGELFVALVGKRFDGHAFLQEAFARGAAGAVVERWPLPLPPIPGAGRIPGTDFQGRSVWKVSNTLAALISLARFHRERFHLDVVAVTGSCGKTTTKSILVHLLATSRKMLFTPGSQNNLIGVPLTLLRLSRVHQAAVLELGTNRWGEIRRLAKLAQPRIGVVTNVGPAHLEAFKSLRGVLRAKGELWEAMDPASSHLVLNADDPLLWEAGHRLPHPVVWFGTHPQSDLRADRVALTSWGSRCRVNGRFDLHLPMPGRHNLMNALAALACAQLLGEDLEEMLEQLWDIPKLPGRLFARQIAGAVFLDDTYNANPDSLKAALQVLRSVPCQGRRILVMGDMLELGKQAKFLHAQAGRWAVEAGIDLLITVGPLTREMVASAWEAGLPLERSEAFDSPEAAGRFLFEQLRPGDAVLLKGSRGMCMEQVMACSTTSSIR